MGAHVSSAGGVDRVVERALGMRAEAVQLWVDPPQRFPRTALDRDGLARLRAALARARLPTYVHVPYLVNLATRDRALRRLSIEMLARALRACALGGLAGAVVHLGSHLGRGYDAVRGEVLRALEEACARADVADRLLVENAAGAGGQIGAELDELRDITDELRSRGIAAAVCLDLQHAHASFGDISRALGVAALAEALRAHRVADRIALVHANDSAAPAGSRLDRHANPGEGSIGWRGFRALARVPELARVPWVLEVPGPERRGPTRREVERMRRYVRRV